jgi:hypothetical protein
VNLLREVADTLAGLLGEGGPADPTFQRMASVYREVTLALGVNGEYEHLLAGLLATAAAHAARNCRAGALTRGYHDARAVESGRSGES